jgi:mRNA interferase MazF
MNKTFESNYRKREPQSSGDWVYRRGDIYLANLNPFKGSEQGGTRPVLVLQNNDGNIYCPTLIIAPMTTQLKKQELPTHVLFERVKGLPLPSMVSLEQITTIDKCRIITYLGKLTRLQMVDVDEACKKSLGMAVPECVEAP